MKNPTEVIHHFINSVIKDTELNFNSAINFELDGKEYEIILKDTTKGFSLLTPIEYKAIGQSLSEIPEGKTAEEIIQMIKDEHEDIIIWEPFLRYSNEFVVANIKNDIDSLTLFMKTNA